jgi:hypothetical protein
MTLRLGGDLAARNIKAAKTRKRLKGSIYPLIAYSFLLEQKSQSSPSYSNVVP